LIGFEVSIALAGQVNSEFIPLLSIIGENFNGSFQKLQGIEDKKLLFFFVFLSMARIRCGRLRP
jgi:hypothetical protein